MKALTTQFDNGRLSNTVATPTCCCCCCCCCCLTTSVISTSVLTDNIDKSCKKNKIKDKRFLIAMSIVSIPVALLISQSLCSIIAYISYPTDEVNLISSTFNSFLFRSIALFLTYLSLIWALYKAAGDKKPFVRSSKLISGTAVALIAEAFAGMLLMFNAIAGNNSGAIGLVIYIVLSLSIILFYFTKIKKHPQSKVKK